MANALFAFNDSNAGEQAARRLAEQGVPRERIELHAHERAPDKDTARHVDEQVTGGLISNVLELFRGVFEWGASPHDASAYEEVIRRGGAVVSVDASSEEEQSKTDEVMLAAGCNQHTGWKTASTKP